MSEENQEVEDENSPHSLGYMIDLLYDLRERRRELEAQSKALKGEMDDLEEALLQKMDKDGIESTRTGIAIATISEQEVPSVVDWTEVESFIKQQDALYLFERRLSSRAWREMRESGTDVPGTEPFKRRSLSLAKRQR